jgi:hypothetical protein
MQRSTHFFIRISIEQFLIQTIAKSEKKFYHEHTAFFYLQLIDLYLKQQQLSKAYEVANKALKYYNTVIPKHLSENDRDKAYSAIVGQGDIARKMQDILQKNHDAIAKQSAQPS